MSRPDPLTMTLDELRDFCAHRDNWAPFVPDEFGEVYWHKYGDNCDPMNGVPHPFDATLDGAHSAMPEGWTWFRVGKFSEVTAWHGLSDDRKTDIEIPDTGDPKTDLYRLAVACCMAEDQRKETP